MEWASAQGLAGHFDTQSFFGRCVSSRRSCSLSQSFPRAECKLLFLWKVFPTHFMKWDGRWENSREHTSELVLESSCVSRTSTFSASPWLYISEMKNHPRCPELIYTGTCILCSVLTICTPAHLGATILCDVLSVLNWKPFCFAQYWLFLHITQIRIVSEKRLRLVCPPCALLDTEGLLCRLCWGSWSLALSCPSRLGGASSLLIPWPLQGTSQAWFALIWKLKPGCSKSGAKKGS